MYKDIAIVVLLGIAVGLGLKLRRTMQNEDDLSRILIEALGLKIEEEPDATE